MDPASTASAAVQPHVPVPAIVRARALSALRRSSASRRDLEQVVELDPALIGTVSRLARCPLFGGVADSLPLPQLIDRVGRSALAAAVAALPRITPHSDEAEVEASCRFWLEAVALAAASRWLANTTGHVAPQEVYTAGLLYDLGARVRGPVAERDPGECVRRLLERWRLSPAVSRIVVEAWSGDTELPEATEIAGAPGVRELVERGAVISARLGHRRIPLHDVPFSEFELEGAGEAIDLELRHVADVLGLPDGDMDSLAGELVAAELAALPDGEAEPTERLVRGHSLGDVAAVHQSLLAARGMASIIDILNGALRSLYRGLSFERVMLLETDRGRSDCLRARAAPLHPLQVRLERGFGAVVVPMDPEGALHQALATGMPMLGGGPRDAVACAHLGVTSFGVAPLVASSHQMGVVLVDHFLSDRRVTGGDVAMLGLLTASLGLVIENMALDAQGRKLRALAEKDELTGINNRRNQLQQLQRELDRSRRYGTPLSVVMIDVDHFKRWNDVHGHQVGDSVLSAVAQIVASCSRDIDHFGRWGGEEFLVVLPETTLDRAVMYAERLRLSIEGHGRELADVYDGSLLSVSIGVTSLAPRRDDVSALVNRADEALYSAKNAGRNRVHVREPDGDARAPATHELSQAGSTETE